MDHPHAVVHEDEHLLVQRGTAEGDVDAPAQPVDRQVYRHDFFQHFPTGQVEPSFLEIDRAEAPGEMAQALPAAAAVPGQRAAGLVQPDVDRPDHVLHPGDQALRVGGVDLEVAGQDHQPAAVLLQQQFPGLVHQAGVIDVVQDLRAFVAARRLAAAVQDDGIKKGRKPLPPGDGAGVLVVIEDATEDLVLHKFQIRFWNRSGIRTTIFSSNMAGLLSAYGGRQSVWQTRANRVQRPKSRAGRSVT